MSHGSDEASGSVPASAALEAVSQIRRHALHGLEHGDRAAVRCECTTLILQQLALLERFVTSGDSPAEPGEPVSREQIAAVVERGERLPDHQHEAEWWQAVERALDELRGFVAAVPAAGYKVVLSLVLVLWGVDSSPRLRGRGAPRLRALLELVRGSGHHLRAARPGSLTAEALLAEPQRRNRLENRAKVWLRNNVATLSHTRSSETPQPPPAPTTSTSAASAASSSSAASQSPADNTVSEIATGIPVTVTAISGGELNGDTRSGGSSAGAGTGALGPLKRRRGATGAVAQQPHGDTEAPVPDDAQADPHQPHRQRTTRLRTPHP